MNIQIFPWTFVSFALLSSHARAGAILSDDFNYTNGVLQTVSSGKWAATAARPTRVDISNGALNLNGSESQDVSALLAGQPFATTNGLALYVGFDLRITALPSGTGSHCALQGCRGGLSRTHLGAHQRAPRIVPAGNRFGVGDSADGRALN